MSLRLNRRALLAGTGATGAALLLGACSSGGDDTPAAGADQQRENSATVLPDYIAYEGVDPDIKGTDGMGDVFFAYPGDPVEATSEAPGDGQPLTHMGITNTPQPPPLEQNEFWQETNQRLGSELQVQLYQPADYTDKFPTVLASGDFPDYWAVGSAPRMPEVMDKFALDLSEHLSGDAVAAYPFLANIPQDAWRATVYNGKIMGIPVPRGAFSTYILYGRSDLLADYGITEGPTSFEDLYDKAKEVTSPAENRFAFTYVPSDYVRQMYGVPNGWSLENGELVSANEHPGQVDALEGSRRLFTDGLVMPDAFSAAWGAHKDRLVAGQALYTFDSFSGWNGIYSVAAGRDIALAAYAVPKADGGGTARSWLGNAHNSICAINKKAGDRVETILNIMNYLAAPFGTAEYLFRKFGTEGEHYTLDGTDPKANDNGRTETQLGTMYMVDAPMVVYNPGMPEDTQAQYDAQAAIIPEGLKNPVSGLYSETNNREGGALNRPLNDLRNQILQGRADVSQWEPAVQKWKADGGDKIRDELMAALAAVEGR